MPQTLLAILALVIAGVVMLGQNRTMNDSVHHVMEDEFEVMVSGVMLHTLEFADSRAFDDATTPKALRERLGLKGIPSLASIDTLSADDLRGIEASDFAPLSRFGTDLATLRPAGCDLRNLAASRRCDDISDLQTNDVAGKPVWKPVGLTTSGGDSVGVELRIVVNYVEIDDPDTAVDYPTFHKRVDVYARSPLLNLTDPGHGIYAHRVISYDPVVASEYLRRALRKSVDNAVSEAALALAAAREAERIAGEALNVARTASERADADRDVAESALSKLEREFEALSSAVNAAQADLASAQQGTGSAPESLVKAFDKAKKEADKAQGELEKDYAKWLKTRKSSDWEKVVSSYAARNAANAAASAAEAALQAADGAPSVDPGAVAAAQRNLAAATSAAASAEAALAAARQAAASAQAKAASAQAALQAAMAAYNAAQEALQQAIADHEVAERRAEYRGRS